MLAHLLLAQAARADTEVQVHLLTMGPGEHLYTRAGHAALMVADVHDGRPGKTVVYNYGETNWDDPAMMSKFIRGESVFFLKEVGHVVETVNKYAVRQGRSVYRQRLRLTPAQVRQIVRRLEHEAKPGNSDYIIHHTNTTCSSKILDLLDDVLGNPIRRQLAGAYGPKTWREHFHWGLSGDWLASIAAELFLGRHHDLPLSKRATTVIPAYMRVNLQQIMVPDPSGSGRRVGLAAPPITMAQRKVPVVTEQSWFTHWFWGALIALTLFGGFVAYREAPEDRVPAGKLLLGIALGSGSVGLALLLLMLLSHVREYRANELFLLFQAADLLLLPTAVRWLRGKPGSARALKPYTTFRLGLVVLVVIAHGAGLLYQQPRILLVLAVVVAAVQWAVIDRLVRARAPA